MLHRAFSSLSLNRFKFGRPSSVDNVRSFHQVKKQNLTLKPEALLGRRFLKGQQQRLDLKQKCIGVIGSLNRLLIVSILAD